MRFGRHDEAHNEHGVGAGGEHTGGLLSDLATGGGEAEEFSTEGGSSRGRVPLTLVVLAVVAIGGAGGIAAMRHHGMGSGMSFETAQIEYTADRGSSADEKEVERVLSTLSQSGRPLQVPHNQIELNPFQLQTAPVVSDTSGDDLASRRAAEEAARRAERERVARQQRLEEIETKLRGLRVQSVMPGPQPLARINNQIVREGDLLEEMFIVKRIEGSQVLLEADDEIYVVTLATTGSRNRPTRRRR